MEWDDRKNEINKRKLGISFETAAHVVEDINRLEYFDEAHSADEDRFIVIGLVRNVLFVVYTDRGDATRIISARKATEAETEVYYDNYTQDDL